MLARPDLIVQCTMFKRCSSKVLTVVHTLLATGLTELKDNTLVILKLKMTWKSEEI